MKTKFKVLVAFIVAICITTMGTVVNATTEFYDKDTDVTVTLDKDLEIEGKYNFDRIDYVYYYWGLDTDVYVTDVDQKALNEYASAERTYNAEFEIPLSKIFELEVFTEDEVSFADVEKYYISVGQDENNEDIWKEVEAQIKEIDGEKYLVSSQKLSHFVYDSDIQNNNRDVAEVYLMTGRS